MPNLKFSVTLQAHVFIPPPSTLHPPPFLFRLQHRHRSNQVVDDVGGAFAFDFGLGADDQPLAENAVGNGVDVLAEVRRWSQVPVVVLSAVGDEEQKVRALDAGADDYVTKPFGTEELLARMRAVLRRRLEEGDSAVKVGDLEIDLADRSVSREGEVVHLTRIEFDLLSKLAEHPGRLVTQRQLLQGVWGPGYEDETHYLRVHFAHVRAKIEPDPSNPRYVITEPGIGYRLRAEQ